MSWGRLRHSVHGFDIAFMVYHVPFIAVNNIGAHDSLGRELVELLPSHILTIIMRDDECGDGSFKREESVLKNREYTHALTGFLRSN